jgi:hypothetical protein
MTLMEGQNWHCRGRCWGRLGLLVFVCLLASGCARQEDETAPEPRSAGPGEFTATTNPALSYTLQADAAATAASVAGSAVPSTATREPAEDAGVEPPVVAGTPLAALTGPCPVPEGFVLHVREGFCIAAPETWTPFNVDGGMAASLGTTPGQAISLRPDWAADTSVCTLMVYIITGRTADEHLAERYDSFERRADLAELSPLRTWALGDVAIPGFTWASTAGEAGGTYADALGFNRLMHVGYSGTSCPLEDLLPTIQTLRFDLDQ